MTLSASETGLLHGGRFRIAKNSDHKMLPTTLVLKKLLTCLSRWQQKHHPIPQETQTSPILLCKVVDVLLKLLLLRIVLWNKGYDSLHFVVIHISQVGAVTHI